ncbi:MAG: hypothetical protein RIG84_03930 [Roseovarius sp.]
MHIECLSLQQVRYNPERSAFEALVNVVEAGTSYRYPVEVKAPLNAEFGFVSRRLSEAARQIHRHAPAREMRLRRAPVPAEAPRPARDTIEPRFNTFAPAAHAA